MWSTSQWTSFDNGSFCERCVCRAFSSSLLRAIITHNHLHFKIFSYFVQFCPNFQIFYTFLPFLNIFLHFFALFLKNRAHALSRIGPGMYNRYTDISLFYSTLWKNVQPPPLSRRGYKLLSNFVYLHFQLLKAILKILNMNLNTNEVSEHSKISHR